MYKLVMMMLMAASVAMATDDPSEAWKVTIEDRLGNPMWEITDVRTDVHCTPRAWSSACEFSVTAKNISGETILSPFIDVTVYWTDGKTDRVNVSGDKSPHAPGELTECKGLLLGTHVPIFDPRESIDPTTDGRIKAVGITGEARESPQEKAKFQREQDELRAARQREREAQERRREAEERPIKIACSAAYHSTIDKVQRDLTVREAKLVEYCTLLGWYHQ